MRSWSQQGFKKKKRLDYAATVSQGQDGDVTSMRRVLTFVQSEAAGKPECSECAASSFQRLAVNIAVSPDLSADNVDAQR